MSQKKNNSETENISELDQTLILYKGLKITDNVEMKKEDLIYNPKNKIFTLKDLTTLFKKYGVTNKPNNISYYQQAFVHNSYTIKKNQSFIDGNILCPENCIPLQEKSYEILEFFGDSTYNHIITRYISERYENQSEGVLSKLKNLLIMGSTQAQLAEHLGFNEFLIISSDFEKRNSRKNEKLLKDAVEAFLGAIEKDFDEKPELNLSKKGYPPYLGFGYQVASKFLIQVIENHIDIGELIIESRDYVDEFTKLMKSRNKEIEFSFQSKEKINGEDLHKCVVKNQNHILAHGYGKTQRESKKDCAKNALKIYQYV